MLLKFKKIFRVFIKKKLAKLYSYAYRIFLLVIFFELNNSKWYHENVIAVLREYLKKKDVQWMLGLTIIWCTQIDLCIFFLPLYCQKWLRGIQVNHNTVYTSAFVCIVIIHKVHWYVMNWFIYTSCRLSLRTFSIHVISFIICNEYCHCLL